MRKVGAFDLIDEEIIESHVENIKTIKRLYGEDILLKHIKSDLRIMVDAKDIQKQQRGIYGFIDGKAALVNDRYSFNGKIEVDCRIACGKLYKLKDRIDGEKINLLDHLDLLLPAFDCIGLFTFQNGIQNSEDDFKNMGKKIIEKLPERPLCIGFYNGTNGIGIEIINDISRLPEEWHLNANSVIIFRQMLVALVKILSSIKSRKIWCVHIAHSEAGLIANEVLTTARHNLSQQYLNMDNFLKDHVITLTYGAVAPIPDVVHLAINTYSRDDVTMWFAKMYLDKLPKPARYEDEALKKTVITTHSKLPVSMPVSMQEDYALKKTSVNQKFISSYPHNSTKNGYTLTVIESKVPKKEQPLIEKDHAFDGATYQIALENNIKDLRERFKIHDCR